MGRALRLLAVQKARPGDMGTPGRTNKRPAEHRRPIERGVYEKPACSLAAFFRVRFANDHPPCAGIHSAPAHGTFVTTHVLYGYRRQKLGWVEA
jgi:hypothetical protein